MDEENPTYTGLTQEIGLAHHNCPSYRGWYEAQ